jgi:hypothetical protein
MAVEAAEPVAWTKPEGLSLAGGDSMPGLGGQFEEGFHALSCDGWSTSWTRGSTPSSFVGR